MARKNRRSHHESKDISNMDINALSMVAPTMIGAPLGTMPIMPVIPTDVELNDKDNAEDDDRDRLP